MGLYSCVRTVRNPAFPGLSPCEALYRFPSRRSANVDAFSLLPPLTFPPPTFRPAFKMAVNASLAFILVASWINCLLFMAECILVVRYFQHASRLPLHRLGVGLMFTSDVLGTMAICAETFLTILTSPCDTSDIFTRDFLRANAVVVLTTNTTAALAHLFLIFLYFSLTKNRLFSAVLLLSSAAHLILQYVAAITMLVEANPLGKGLYLSKVSDILSVATDITIAAALLHTFVRMDITSAVRGSTHSLLRRLSILFFTSGVVVATTTLLAMTLALKFNPAYALFFFAQGRVFGITILGNFALGVSARHSASAAVATTTGAPATVTGVVFRLDDYRTGSRDRGGPESNYSRHSTATEVDGDGDGDSPEVSAVSKP
ncbi:hypothetical protein C8R46DRAFT_258531 [Mycena filopes]|nr:hypothetical protein C8R46DRAFT_258531 [Mycena filopes]